MGSHFRDYILHTLWEIKLFPPIPCSVGHPDQFRVSWQQKIRLAHGYISENLKCIYEFVPAAGILIVILERRQSPSVVSVSLSFIYVMSSLAPTYYLSGSFRG